MEPFLMHNYRMLPLLFLLTASLPAADWTGFRGSEGLSTSAEKNLPTKWSQTEGLKWKAELPGRGLSNPAIAEGRIYVTAVTSYRERRLMVLCFEQATGKKLWERQFTATGATGCHPMTNMAAPTPVTDGKNVYALFATSDVVALDRDGNLLWYRSLVNDYPTLTNQVGMASSPVLAGGLLVVPMENAGESFLAGLDLKTGENVWKTERPRDINWVTPLATKLAGKDTLIFHGTKDVTAYEPATGKVLWTFPAQGASTIPSSTAGGGMLFVPGGQFLALKPTKATETPEVVWRSPRLPLGFTSPVYSDGKIYGVTRIGVVCVDALTGNNLWQQRLEGSFAASPVLADGKLYVVNQEGATHVLDITGAKPKILTTNTLDDTILATPAVVNGCLYLRSDKYLYCVGK
jgi:outer membrane protein assembly factor BamB